MDDGEVKAAICGPAAHVPRAFDHDHFRMPALLGESRLIYVEHSIRVCIALDDVLHALVEKLP